MQSKVDYLKKYASKKSEPLIKLRKKKNVDPSKKKKKKDLLDSQVVEPAKEKERQHSDDEAKNPLEIEAPRSGLFTGEEFGRKQKRIKEQQEDFDRRNNMDFENKTETVYRDKKGKKLDMLTEMIRQKEEHEGKVQKQKEEEYEWGTGKVQKQDRIDKLQEYEDAKSMPFARYQNDDKLETILKERVRDGDPMMAYLAREKNKQKKVKHKKKHKKTSSSSSKETAATKKVYTGPEGHPNRFGIRPGYRWDGVVRGNGWEQKIIEKKNAVTAVDEQAYMYSTADM